MKRESDVWEIINREKKERKRINDGIGMKQWKEYFAGLLGGIEERMVSRKRRVEKEGMREQELGREEVRRMTKSLTS